MTSDAEPRRMTTEVRAYYERKWPPDALMTAMEGKPDIIGLAMVGELLTELRRVEAESDDLRRQVAVARTALDALVREAGAGNQAARAIAIYREAIAALAPQTGEVGS